MQEFPHADARLGQDVDRAQFQRAQGHVAAVLGVAGADHHGQRSLAHQLAQEGQPIHARHFDVEHDHVGGKARHLLLGDQWVRGDLDVDVGLAGENGEDGLANYGRIVHHEHVQALARLRHYAFLPGASPPSAEGRAYTVGMTVLSSLPPAVCSVSA